MAEPSFFADPERARQGGEQHLQLSEQIAELSPSSVKKVGKYNYGVEHRPNLRQLVRRLRNAVAHFKIEPVHHDGEVTGYSLRDQNSFHAELSLVEIKALQSDRLLPAAPAGVATYRQKFQRAFAQEFLCPSSALADYLGSEEPDDDAIDDAGRYFGVSSLAVKTILVNKGNMERSILSPYSGLRVARP